MADVFAVHINGKECEAQRGQTLLEVCERNDIRLPLLCYVEGLSSVGACRLCLVEVEGSPKLFPACATPVEPNLKIQTHTEKIRRYRRMIIELFFAERNHVCAVCVANNHCELQDLARSVGMDHVRFPYLYPPCGVDASHEKYLKDDNRCIMCTRCVRVCDEVEGAHVWDVAGRGFDSRIIAEFNDPWGTSTSCTACGKCVEICPVGALWPKTAALGHYVKRPEMITELVERRSTLT